MLTPLIVTNKDLDNNNQEDLIETKLPSKTYKMDFETGKILAKFINKDEALMQFIIKTIKTTRDKYLIYSDNYGCEVNHLLGKSYSKQYLQMEIPRLINEALTVDDRVQGTKDFIIEKEDDVLYLSFYVITDSEKNVRVEVSI